MIVNNIIVGNCKEKLKDIPNKSVRCCVTSPPYYGLRDYGTGKWEGGDMNCNHEGNPMRTKENINKNTGTGDDVKNKENKEFLKYICDKCGAIRIDEQIGLESTPEQRKESPKKRKENKTLDHPTHGTGPTEGPNETGKGCFSDGHRRGSAGGRSPDGGEGGGNGVVTTTFMRKR